MWQRRAACSSVRNSSAHRSAITHGRSNKKMTDFFTDALGGQLIKLRNPSMPSSAC